VCVSAEPALESFSASSAGYTQETLLTWLPQDLTKRWSEPLTGAKIYFR
jgi:hypothetical protein